MTTVIEILQRQIEDLRIEKKELMAELHQVRIELCNARIETQQCKEAYADLKTSAERFVNTVERNLNRMR